MAVVSYEERTELTRKRAANDLSLLIRKLLNAKQIEEVQADNAFQAIFLNQLKDKDPRIRKAVFDQITQFIYGKAGVAEKLRESEEKDIVVSFRGTNGDVKGPPKIGRPKKELNGPGNTDSLPA